MQAKSERRENAENMKNSATKKGGMLRDFVTQRIFLFSTTFITAERRNISLPVDSAS
jgi:hypothetical protein